MTLEDFAGKVESREELLHLIRTLGEDLRRQPSSWENRDLYSYLEALAGWLADMEGFYKARGENLDELPVWRIFADALMAARVYE